MDHTCCRSARLYYTTSTRQAGLLFLSQAELMPRNPSAQKSSVKPRGLLVPLHRRLRDLRGVPTEAEGRTRPGQASIEKP